MIPCHVCHTQLFCRPLLPAVLMLRKLTIIRQAVGLLALVCVAIFKKYKNCVDARLRGRQFLNTIIVFIDVFPHCIGRDIALQYSLNI